MATGHFTFNHTTGGALKFFDASSGLVYDFNDATFKAHASATTPAIAMSAAAADSLGTGRQLNYLAFNLSRLYRGPGKKRFFVGKYAGTTPAATVNPTEWQEIVVQAGELDYIPPTLPARISCRTLDGYAVQLTAEARRGGQPIDLLTCGRALFTVNATTDVFTSAGHGLSNGDYIVMHTVVGVLPTGLTAGTAYEVSDVTTDTFKLVGVNCTDTGTAPNYWDKPTCVITVREHGSGSLAFTSATLTAADIRSNQFEGEYPGGAAFTVNSGTDVITSAGHGLSDGAQIALQTGAGGTLPAGLSESTTYYVRDATTDTFKVELTPSGGAVDITDTGTGVFNWIPATALLRGDRQYDVSVTMVLAGETITDSWQELAIG